MVTQYGMTEALGFMRLSEGDQGFLGQSLGQQPAHSDGTATAIDDEVRRLLDNAQLEAETILSAHRHALEAMAQELLERETLDADDIARLFADVPKWRREQGDNGVLHRSPEPVNRHAAA
jgi:cell division protease FtsH